MTTLMMAQPKRVQLTPEQIQMLRNEGYSDKDIQEAIGEVEREQSLRQAQQNARNVNVDPRQNSQQSLFSYNPNDNLIKWQLELNEILERMEHILREDIVEYKAGNILWIPNKNNDERIFTNYGVQEIMRILSAYLNRNTILGNYTFEEVNDIVYDFGKELNDLFFTKYESILAIPKFESLAKEWYGKENIMKDGFISESELSYEQIIELEEEIEKQSLEKRKNYPITVRMLIDVVHSAYSRAIGGQERSSLREARQLTQQEQLNPSGTTINMSGSPQGAFRQRGFFNPARYIFGKYKP